MPITLVYRCRDNEEFLDLAEAQAHEASIEEEMLHGSFIASITINREEFRNEFENEEALDIFEQFEDTGITVSYSAVRRTGEVTFARAAIDGYNYDGSKIPTRDARQ